MTDEQVEYIAEKIADIYKHHSGHVAVSVIPPQTTASGYLDFAFAVEEIPLVSSKDGEQRIIVRIVR